jgi:hypothetical protein
MFSFCSSQVNPDISPLLGGLGAGSRGMLRRRPAFYHRDPLHPAVDKAELPDHGRRQDEGIQIAHPHRAVHAVHRRPTGSIADSITRSSRKASRRPQRRFSKQMTVPQDWQTKSFQTLTPRLSRFPAPPEDSARAAMVPVPGTNCWRLRSSLGAFPRRRIASPADPSPEVAGLICQWATLRRPADRWRFTA